MNVTKLSTKGQIVIPENIRSGIEIGTAFSVIKRDNLIILKQISGLTSEEEMEVEELKEIWKSIEDGKAKGYSKSDFLKKLNEW